MIRLKIALMVLGGVIGFFGIQEWRLALAAKPTPQKITAADLAKKGPGKNAHLELSGYIPVGNMFVYEASSETGPWNTVWLPLQPVGGLFGFAPGGPVRILFKTKKAKNEDELNRIFLGGAPLSGMVINKIESIGSKEKKLLTESYPGIDFNTCYIFEHDRHPAGTGKVVGLMGGGGFLLLIGMAWIAADLKGDRR